LRVDWRICDGGLLGFAAATSLCVLIRSVVAMEGATTLSLLRAKARSRAKT
jgi:hypothetical protein